MAWEPKKIKNEIYFSDFFLEACRKVVGLKLFQKKTNSLLFQEVFFI